MSKASEWAERREGEPPAITLLGGWDFAVNSAGGMNVAEVTSFRASEALRLARWILDTFGDEAPR